MRAAGLQDVVLAWDDTGSMQFADSATEAQKAKAAEIWTRKDDPTYPLVARQTIIDQITTAETVNPITSRAQREFMLAVATLLHVPLDSTGGLARAKALNDQIAALRAQMPPLP